MINDSDFLGLKYILLFISKKNLIIISTLSNIELKLTESII